ncbi:nucleolar protein 10-like [Babylonia areolata]|uniref:nucleolar protein 10-like n=1 Tax=Babylonia areolata TaxID=304850 RepID=UPI003FCF1E12
MQVSTANNVKIYNLSCGKSLPDWLSDQKKRKLQKNDQDLQRRIELIQDFEMPSVSSCVRVSADRNYICATGTYKPKFRCYDVNQLSMKFERGLDAEVIKFMFLEQDYGKVLFLQDDRYIELHTQFGRHYRFRIPKFGRDLDYYKPTCNAYFVGASPEIYRFNLETGQFQAPLTTDASEILCCQFNPQHYLFSCGTKEGTVECWDPRDRTRAAVLDITKSSFLDNVDLTALPAVTSLKFRDGLTLGVGTSTGHVLLYDLRSGLPVKVKDHQYDLPIKDLAFHDPLDLVLSMDRKILKMWDRNTGKPYTSIEPESDLNSLCVVPESGLVLMANEAPKILTYYVPSLGTAPKWCAFLDTLTEELEESEHQSVYDDYKFVTRNELEALGLSQYIGSSLLRAYMHGFFMDVRLYRKFKSIAEPFSYEQFRKDQIRKKIDEQTDSQLKIVKRKLPKVNKDLAYRLQQEAEQMASGEMSKKKKMKRAGTNLLEDQRFGALFEDRDFQIDPTSEEFRLLNPVLARLDVKKKNEQSVLDQFDEVHVEEEGVEGHPSEESSSSSSSSSEDEAEEEESPAARPSKKHKPQEKKKRPPPPLSSKPKMFEVKEGEHFSSLKDKRKKQVKKTLGERAEEEAKEANWSSIGNKEFTYKLKKSYREEEKKRKMEEHKGERRKVRRSAADISKQFKSTPKFWMGQRIK